MFFRVVKQIFIFLNRGSTAFYLLKGYSAFISFIIVVIYAKLLNITDFGKYSFLISSAGVAAALSSLGMPQLAVRKVVTLISEQNVRETKKWISEGIVIQIVSCILFSSIFSFILALKGYPAPFLFLFIIFVGINIVIVFLSEVLRGYQRTLDALIVFEGMRNTLILTTILVYHFFIAKISINSIIIINLVCSVFILYFFYRKKNNIIEIKDVKHAIDSIQKIDYRSIIAESTPFLGIALLGYIQVNDSFILGYFVKEEDLSSISLSFKIFSILLVFGNSTTMWFYPQITNFLINKDKPDELIKKTMMMVGIQMLGAIFFLLIIYSLYDHAVFYLDDSYSQGKELLFIYIFGFILNTFFYQSSIYLLISGYEKIVMLSLLTFISIYIVLSFIFYPVYGLRCIPYFFISTTFLHYLFLTLKTKEKIGYIPFFLPK